MRTFATYLPSSSKFVAVTAAASGMATLLEFPTLQEAIEAVESGAANALLSVAQPQLVDATVLRRTRRNYPAAGILLVAEVGSLTADEAFEYGQTGANALILGHLSKPSALHDVQNRLKDAIHLLEQSTMMPMLDALLVNRHPVVQEALLYAVRSAHLNLTPDQLAEAMRLSRRGLAKRLDATGFPGPHKLLTWGRLIVAAHLLSDGLRVADNVASALRFPSGSAFRNTCQRYLGTTPHGIAEKGGVAWVCAQFQKNLGPQAGKQAADKAAPARGGPNTSVGLALTDIVTTTSVSATHEGMRHRARTAL